MPSYLAKESTFKIPFLGTVLNINQGISVTRDSAEDRAATKKRLLDHIANPLTPPVLVFPEGTTCRNDFLIQFKAGGAFAAGVPVQPMVIKYGSFWGSKFDLSNTPGQDTKRWALRLPSETIQPSNRGVILTSRAQPANQCTFFVWETSQYTHQRGGLKFTPMSNTGHLRHMKQTARKRGRTHVHLTRRRAGMRHAPHQHAPAYAHTHAHAHEHAHAHACAPTGFSVPPTTR